MDRLRVTEKNLSHDSRCPVEIETKHLQNISLELYRYANLSVAHI
jgi:hypothetical protein